MLTWQPTKHPAPIRLYRNQKEFFATAAHGEPTILQGDGSDVSLNLPEDSKGIFLTTVHTEHSKSRKLIPDKECIVGPSVEVEHKATSKETPCVTYTLKIPHIVKDRHLWEFIRIRKGNIEQSTSLQELEQRSQIEGEPPYFVMDEHHATIYTSTFSLFTCTSCKNSCNGTAIAFLLAQSRHYLELEKTTVKLKTFLCSDLYRIPDFKNVSHYSLHLKHMLLNCGYLLYFKYLTNIIFIS